MNLRKIITITLLLFVGISVVFLVLQGNPNGAKSTTPAGVEDSDRIAKDQNNGAHPGSQVLVYYFHGNTRCPTCLTLEAYAKEVVTSAFADELKVSRLVWEVINFDEPLNEHFVRDYDLAFQSLVVVKLQNGTEVEFNNLDKIWDLVGDKQAYFEFVEGEIESYLGNL